MKELIISENQAEQRADKFLKKYLSKAESGFIYKMIRKKNITLNDKKMTGSEKLHKGDSIKIYFSDETLNQFVTDTGNISTNRDDPSIGRKRNAISGMKIDSDRIIYEDQNVILFNKPVGMLSQKAEKNDISANELLIQYMMDTNQLSREELKTFKPAVCNRLDRNTSGILIFGKTFPALQKFAEMLKKRDIHKYYLCIVKGEIHSTDTIKGYLRKNKKNNLVEISEKMCEKDEYDKESNQKNKYRDQENKKKNKNNEDLQKNSKNSDENYQYIETKYCPIVTNGQYTLLKVLLITGKTHQIRAHLASIHHPIIGDKKYGNKEANGYFEKKYGLKNQLLHSYELMFDQVDGKLGNLSYKTFKADLPAEFKIILEGEKINGNLE